MAWESAASTQENVQLSFAGARDHLLYVPKYVI